MPDGSTPQFRHTKRNGTAGSLPRRLRAGFTHVRAWPVNVPHPPLHRPPTLRRGNHIMKRLLGGYVHGVLDPSVVGIGPRVVGVDPSVVGIGPRVVGVDPSMVGILPSIHQGGPDSVRRCCVSSPPCPPCPHRGPTTRAAPGAGPLSKFPDGRIRCPTDGGREVRLAVMAYGTHFRAQVSLLPYYRLCAPPNARHGGCGG